MSSAGVTTVSRLCYLILVAITAGLIAVSAIFLLSQAARTAPNGSWVNNVNAVIVGASYLVVLFVSLAVCLKRRIAVRRKLQRISKTQRTIGKGDVPKRVHHFISQEYARACLIAHDSLPPELHREGFGKTGTKHAGINFRRALLSTIPEIDSMTRLVIIHQPPLLPHDRMLHHLRTIVQLFPRDEYGLTVVHYYDSAIQLARLSVKEPTEEEFQMGMDAAAAIKRVLHECHLEMSDASSSNTHEQRSTEL